MPRQNLSFPHVHNKAKDRERLRESAERDDNVLINRSVEEIRGVLIRGLFGERKLH